jgi:hypothetical protein
MFLPCVAISKLLVEDSQDGTKRQSAELFFRVHVADVGTAMTRGDFAMNWDQIENKWAAMTRRIRSDWSHDRIDATADVMRRVKAKGVTMVTIADRQIAVGDDPGLKISAK